MTYRYELSEDSNTLRVFRNAGTSYLLRKGDMYVSHLHRSTTLHKTCILNFIRRSDGVFLVEHKARGKLPATPECPRFLGAYRVPEVPLAPLVERPVAKPVQLMLANAPAPVETWSDRAYEDLAWGQVYETRVRATPRAIKRVTPVSMDENGRVVYHDESTPHALRRMQRHSFANNYRRLLAAAVPPPSAAAAPASLVVVSSPRDLVQMLRTSPEVAGALRDQLLGLLREPGVRNALLDTVTAPAEVSA